MFTDKHVFLISGCGDLLLVRGYGETREEAKSYLGLNSSYSLVEDASVIRDFVAKEEKEIAAEPHNDKLIAEYVQDLASLKQSLENPMLLETASKIIDLFAESQAYLHAYEVTGDDSMLRIAQDLETDILRLEIN